MYCPKCGKENPDNAQLCSSCSSPLTTDTAKAAPALDKKTSGLAITSLILAILSPFTCMLSAIPAIILGIVALVKISKSQGQLKGNGLAIAGIAVPVAALPIIALLMGILMPVMARTRQIALRLQCGSNMSSLGKAMLIYANEHDNKFPTTSKWCDLLIEHTDVANHIFLCKGAPGCKVNRCYDDTTGQPCSYAMNKNVEGLNREELPADMVLLFETEPGWNKSGGPEILSTENHYRQGCNILFVDCHVEWIDTVNLDELKWTPD